jgi:DNA-binding SARP family transcriptional activator/tetratricopeptide (TPR) repeat protein
MNPQKAIRVHLLGSITVSSSDHRSTALRGSLRQALFGYLIVHGGQRLMREDLARLFWPELETSAALRALRNILYRLRIDLTDSGVPADLLQQDYASVQVNAELISADCRIFAADAELLQRHDHDPASLCAACREAARRMIELYRGEFLPGLFDDVGRSFQDWLTTLRSCYARQAIQAAALLSERSFQRGEYAEAADGAQHWIALERWNERAYRLLMEALARRGDRNGAMAAFRRCRYAVRREFGTEPEIATFNLYNRIRSGRLEPTALPQRVSAPLQRLALQQRIIRQLEQPDCRLITLTGLAGSGKSTLLELLAQRFNHRSEPAVTFVQLNGSTTAGSAAAALSMALGLDLNSTSDPYHLLRREFSQERRILLLDQFDHLSDTAELLRRLTGWPDGPQIVVTARAPFGLADEWRQPVEGLDCGAVEWDGAGAWPEAVQLIVDTIRVQSADYLPGAAVLRSFAAAARRVEGLPLAVALLAEQQTVALAEQSAPRRRREATGELSMHERVQRVIADSWRLLSAAEQRLLQGLSLLRAGFSLDTAHAIAADLELPAVPLETQLYDFADRGLLRISGGARFNWHALVHRFAAERFAAMADAEDVIGRYVAHFSRRALAIAGRLERVESVSSDSWQVDLADHVEALRLAYPRRTPEELSGHLSALVRILILAGRQDVGLALLRDLRALLEQRDDAAAAATQLLLGRTWLEEARLAYYAGAIDHVLFCSEQGRRCGEAVADRDVLLRSRIEATRALLVTNDLRTAADHVQMIEQLRADPDRDPLTLSLADRVLLQYYAEIADSSATCAAAERLLGPSSRGDREMRGTAILVSTSQRWSLGDYRGAIDRFWRFLSVPKTRAAVGDDWTFRIIERLHSAAPQVFDAAEVQSVRYPRMNKATSIVTHFVALLLARLGLFAAAEAGYRDALQTNYGGGGPWSRRGILVSRARLARQLGNHEQARSYALEALRLSQTIGDQRHSAAAEVQLGCGFLAEQPEVAVAHFASALERFQRIGVEALCAEPLAGLAEAALQRGDRTEARYRVDQILALDWPYFWFVDDPVATMVTVARVLQECGDGAWRSILDETVARINQIAAALPAGECAEAFRAIPSHRAACELLSLQLA